jgi:Fur family peroxide stress response transcriptional regulator
LTAPTRRDLFINVLRQAGRRITDQRLMICDYLAATESHPTPYQVYAELSAEYPEISRATVYNTLKVLQELGAIVEIGVGTDHRHYETDTAPHVNLICLRCHTVTDLPAPETLADVRASVKDAQGFHPLAVRMDVYGFCAACRARKKAEIRAQWLAQRRGSTDVDPGPDQFGIE